MNPTAVLTAIVFGSASAISFGLTATMVVFAVLRGEHPELAREFPGLLRSCLVFAVLATIAGVTLYGSLRQLRWRSRAQIAMWLTVAAIGWVYWPK